MAVKALYSMDLGTYQVSLRLPDSYDAIAADVGLTKVAAGAATIPPSTEVSSLLKNGKANRIRLSFATTTGRRKVANIICSTEKLDTAINSLVGKTYNANTIATAYFPSRRRFT